MSPQQHDETQIKSSRVIYKGNTSSRARGSEESSHSRDGARLINECRLEHDEDDLTREHFLVFEMHRTSTPELQDRRRRIGASPQRRYEANNDQVYFLVFNI